MNYPSQLAILLGLTGGGLILSLMASMIIWLVMQGASMPGTADEILKPKYYNVNMVIQLVSTFFIFFLPVILFARICYRQPKRFLGFNTNFNYQQVLLLILILMVTVPLVATLTEVNKILPIPQHLALKFKAMESAREAQEAALININSASKYVISLLVIGLAPAVFEETFFRSGLQNFLSRWFKRPWIAIVLSSIIFSLIHLSYYGFLVRFGLGVILGLIFYYSGSLWLSILFHFLVNGVQVTFLYLVSLHHSAEKSIPDITVPIWPILPTLIVMFFLFNLFRKKSEAQQIKYPVIPNAEDDLYEWTRHN